MASAKVVVARAFNELKVTDVSRAQLQSAATTLKVPLSSTEYRSKDVLVANVAKALIDQGLIRVPVHAAQTFARLM